MFGRPRPTQPGRGLTRHGATEQGKFLVEGLGVRLGLKAFSGRGRGCSPPCSPLPTPPRMDSPGFSQAMECCVDGCLSNQGLLGGSLLGVYNTVLHHPPSENPRAS